MIAGPYSWQLIDPGRAFTLGHGVAGDQEGLGRQVGALLATLPYLDVATAGPPRAGFELRVQAWRAP